MTALTRLLALTCALATCPLAAQALTPTTTTLTTSPSSVFVGQQFNATVTVVGSGGVPTGTVVVYDNEVWIVSATLDSSGNRSFNVHIDTPGSHSLKAIYFGDSQFSSSVSNVVTQVVKAGSSSTALTTSSATPLVAKSFNLVATVTGSAPTGTVAFQELGTTFATAPLSGGTAILPWSYAVAGAHAITAVYSGDGSNPSSSSAAILVSAMNPTVTRLTSTPNPADVNQLFFVSATVTGDPAGPAQGTVTFFEGATQLVTISMINGTAVLQKSYPSTGTHTFTATYSGDWRNLSSTSSAFVETIAPAKTATTTSLTSSVSPANTGQAITLTATVAGTNPTGSVSLLDGTAVVATAPLTGKVATFTQTYVAAGSHSLKAIYSGDSAYATSSSSVLNQSVVVPVTTTALSSGANPAPYGQPVVVTATVTGNSGNPLTGTATLKEGTVTLGSATLANGAAKFNVSANPGVHSLVATYSGDALHPSSTSPSFAQTVSTAVSQTVLSASKNPSIVSTAVTLTANVVGLTTPTGSVTFKDGATTLGFVNLSAGKATLSVTFASVGPHTISANYAGDLKNAPSAATVTQQVNASGTVSTQPMTWVRQYDPAGNVTATIDPLGNVTSKVYDRLLRATQVQLPAPSSSASAPIVVIGYNALDAVNSVRDPRARTTSYSIDGLSHLNSQSSPDSGSTSQTFDSAGNVLTRRDARGKTATYTFDVLNRVRSIAYATGVASTFEYDGGSAPYPGSAGRLTKLTDESGVTTFTYDSLGRLIARSVVTNGKTLTVSFAYGTSGTGTGRITSLTYPSKVRVNYVYDTAGRISAITVNPPTSNGSATNTSVSLGILSSVTYNADNLLKSWKWANNAPYTRTYDSFGRLASFPIGYPQGTGLAAGLTRTLTYDNAGRITGYMHSNSAGAQPSFNQTFGYDGLDRLTLQTTTATNYGYAYDATGNRTSRTIGGTTYTNTVAATSNRLTDVQTPGTGGVPVSNAQTYTASGSLAADGTASYTYSDRGRMATSTVGGQVTTYKYNGLEQRISKAGARVPTGAAYYAYDEAGQTLGEYDANLYPVAETVYLGTTPVAVLKLTGTAAGNNLALTVGNVYADQIDTPRAITRNSDEAILWRWDGTEAFGNSAANENPSGLGVYKYNQRMPGQGFGAEDQNFYNWNRNYQPSTGRYAQVDPIGLAGGIDPYSYVGGNPLSYVDPDGLQKGPPVRGTYYPRGTMPQPVAFPRQDNFSRAAGYYNPDGSWVCLQWNCPSSADECRMSDLKRSTDFLPTATDALNPPPGCICIGAPDWQRDWSSPRSPLLPARSADMLKTAR